MRKFLFLIIFLPFFTNLHAQEPDEISVDSLLVNIDLSQLSTGILYDRVMPISRLETFNDSVNIANKSYFEQALMELRGASLDQKFTDYKVLRSSYSADSIYSVVDIGIINASFQRLNFNESNESLGALHFSQNLFERINNNQPTLLESHLLLVAPLKEYAMGNIIKYVINPELILQDTDNKDLVSLIANFDSNAEYIIIENGSVIQEQFMIAYEEGGEKILTFTATFQDGSTKTTQGLLHVKLPAPPPINLIDTDTIWGTIPWQGFNETSAHVGKLVYRTFYHTNNGNTQKNLLKPIIVIDGFDPRDRRKIQDGDSPLPDELHRSMEEMMSYTVNGTEVPIMPILRNMGYDIILVNQENSWKNGYYIDGGADYIERNGLNHVRLYQLLNNKLVQNGSNEQLVIVGPSMGGQISRYALAYMEKHGIPHNTRLWISVDSPHLGANIPMGIQSLLHMLKPSSAAAADFVDNQLGSPAARQQLIEQYSGESNDILHQDWLNGRTISQGFSENRGRPIFINYYNNLFNNGLPGSHGYPQNLRKIALINGALQDKKGFDNPFDPNGTGISGTIFPDNYAGNGCQTLKVRGLVNGLGHRLTLESYALPAQGNFHKIAFFKKKIISWIYHDRYVTNSNSRGNMDNVPGGWFPTQRDLIYTLQQASVCDPPFICINNWDIQTMEHVNSFIPTVSALGFHQPNFNWNQSLNRNLVCTGEIPFDSYYGPKKNEQHSSFTLESFEWLLQEIQNNPQPPTVYFEGENLMGPSIICQNDLVTYEFDGCTPIPVTQWQVSNGLEIITSDDFSVTVENTTSTPSSGWIKAIFPNQVVQKELWLGKPSAPAYLNGPEVVATGAIVTYSGGVAEGATAYEWWLPYPFEINNPFDITSPNWQVYPNAGRTTQVFTGNAGTAGYIQLMGSNSCGYGDAVLKYVEHGQGGSGQQQLPVYPFPNTADDAFNLDFSSYPAGNYQIAIYDAFSNTLYQGSSENIEKTISTLEIPAGNYFLHIHLGEEVLQYQLIIQH